jgi:hypothetical protein
MIKWTQKENEWFSMMQMHKPKHDFSFKENVIGKFFNQKKFKMKTRDRFFHENSKTDENSKMYPRLISES